MRILVECVTSVDITETGVRSNYRSQQLPINTIDGRTINDLTQWNHARNQQRNWDTVNQILSLRCLPENISTPRKIQTNGCTHWRFTFEIPDSATVSSAESPVALLLSDCVDVPVIAGLDEEVENNTSLQPGTNIQFRVILDK